MLDRSIEHIVDSALEGHVLDDAELLQLLALHEDSPEASYIRWASNMLGRKASANRGQIYAQIGVDANACPFDCSFCTLAACNSAFKGKAEVPLEEIVSYAQTFDQAGVHLISLMATGALRFERYLEIVAAVRGAVNADMPIMANCGDLDLEQMRQLKNAGTQAFYHAKRLGEGKVTRIAPQTRDATMRAAKDAGLQLMTAVEPVSDSTPLEDIVARMREVIALEPYCSGVGALTIVPKTMAQDAVPVSRRRTTHFACVMRLAAGTGIPFGTGCGNVMWVDAGTNPRGRTLPTDAALLQRDTAAARKALQRDDWGVPARPLPEWFE